MFRRFRDPRGGFTPLAAGAAMLVLAGLAPGLPLPRHLGSALGIGLATGGLLCLAAWAIGKRARRYDLRRLWDAAPPEPEEPDRDTLPEDEPAGPYCGWCDEAYPPGTVRCGHCGRPL